MVTPTEAEIQDQIGKAVKPFEEFRKFLGTHVVAGSNVNVDDNYLNMEATLIQALKTDFAPETLSAQAGVRAALSGVVTLQSGVLFPLFLEYAKVKGFPEVDIQPIFDKLVDAFAAGAVRVTSRQFTFGSPAAGGGNVGDGVVNRLNKSEDNFDLENQTADAKEIKCISDRHTGASEHEEVFQFRGATAEKDQLKITGSGLSAVTIKALSGIDSQTLMRNPSFTGFDTTAGAPDDWVKTGGTLATDVVSFYRGFEGDTPASLKITGNSKITQLFTVPRAQFNANTPYYMQIAYNRAVGSGDGNLNLRIGSKSVSVALVAQVGWNILRLPIGQDNWFSRFNEDAADYEVEIDTNTTGFTLVDDIIIAPYTLVDGSFYAIVGEGGTLKSFLIDDVFTFTDTEIGAVLQYAFWRAFNRWLPHATGGGVTWAEPA